MGRIYVLGAGFSKSAGLPLAGELLGELKAFAYRQPKIISGLGDPQENWDVFEAAASAVAERTLGTPITAETFPDLELLLTLMDWYVRLKDGALNTALRLDITPEQRGLAQDLMDNTVAEEFAKARKMITWLISDYFREFIWAVGRDQGFQQKCIHIDRFAQEVIKPGDTVITFNYDTLVESFLCEAGLWHPGDGYGMPLTLGQEPFASSAYSNMPSPLPNLPPSPVKVLKLHGSASWVKNGDKLGLNTLFLDFLDNHWRHSAIGPLSTAGGRPRGKLRNRAPFPQDQGEGRPSVIIPTYLKTYAETPYADLWRAASVALSAADEVVVVGYSLPKSDVAAQTLLLSVPKTARLTVINPSGARHYENVLGRAVVEVRATLEAWLRSL